MKHFLGFIALAMENNKMKLLAINVFQIVKQKFLEHFNNINKKHNQHNMATAALAVAVGSTSP